MHTCRGATPSLVPAFATLASLLHTGVIPVRSCQSHICHALASSLPAIHSVQARFTSNMSRLMLCKGNVCCRSRSAHMPSIEIYASARACTLNPPHGHQAVCASRGPSHSLRFCLQDPSAVRKAPAQPSSSQVQSLTAASQRPSGPLLEPLEVQLCSMAAGESSHCSLLQCRAWTQTCSRRWLPAQSCLQSSNACSSEQW